MFLILLSFLAFGQIVHLAVTDQTAQGPRVTDTLAMAGLWFCTLCYLVNRFGAALRAPVAKGDLNNADPVRLGQPAPHVTVLIPSYSEEPRVIRMTVLSAALAIYPARDIVVLVDDPISDAASVTRSLHTVEMVRTDLAAPMAHLRAEHRAWLKRRQVQSIDTLAELDRLFQNLHWLADWLDRYGQTMLDEGQPAFAHIDRFFVSSIIAPLSLHYRQAAASLDLWPAIEFFDAAYAQLTSAFCVDITTFQRKQFSNLSHASNKAMNLNAYIALMGGSYRRRSRAKAAFLRAEVTGRPDLVVRRPDYVLTLDADSLIRPEYMNDLIAILEADRGLAVVQTPYLSFPDSTTPVERYAGATTDIQYLVHQGSSFFNAAFWVGANALIRFSAFKDIERYEKEGHKMVPVFIQDRTVIEDTGSTIDLLAKGWGVKNHFASLAHSATPADFGALCIQRKRWCNGGILILGALLRAVVTAPRGSFRPVGFVLRLHYLLSPMIGNISLFFLLINSHPNLPVLCWMAVTVLPYFLLYGLDLRRLGYRFVDLIAVSALNLLLLPVAFSGIAESLVQLATGRKTIFVRTPKVEGRTAVPLIYILFYAVLIANMVRCACESLSFEHGWVMISPALNAVLLLYGVLRFIGFRNAVKDCALAFRR